MFLIHLLAVGDGCRDLAAPENGWVERTEHGIAVHCNFTFKSWHLVCGNGNWIGELSTCSDGK